MEILKHPHPGATRLRILGLSDPEKALQEIIHAQQQPELFQRILERFQKNISGILAGNTQNTVFQTLSCCVLLRADNAETTSELLKKYSLNLIGNNDTFGVIGKGPLLRHRFILTPEGRSVSTILVDGKMIDLSRNELGSTFQKLEKSLGLLVSYMNHDASMHRYGVAVGTETSGGNRLFERELNISDTSGRFNSLEIMAASFHRDLFEELDECGIPLKVSVLKHAEKMLSLISDFKDPFLQKYWLRALGYPLFSLLNPDGEEVQNLREKFPDFRLRATRWGRMIHKKEQNYTIQDTDETIAIPTRMLRQAMMPYYYHQREGVRDCVAQIVGHFGGYPDVEDSSDLRRMSLAKSLGIPLTSTEEEIQETQIFRVFLFRMQTYDEQESALECDRDELHTQLLFFSEKGFPWLEEYLTWDWKGILEKYFHEKLTHLIAEYRRKGKDFWDAHYIDPYFKKIDAKGISLSFSDFPDFFKIRQEKLITAIDQYTRLGDRFHTLSTLKKEYDILLGYGYDIGEVGNIFLEDETISS